MKTYSETIIEICELEKKLDIYRETILGIPIWRIARNKYRKRFVLRHAKILPLSNLPKFQFLLFLKAYINSFIFYWKKVVFGGKVDNILYGFPRLESIEGNYIDKFVDPLIFETNLKNNYIYLERGRSGKHQKPRIINNIIWTEFIDYTSTSLGWIFFPVFGILFGKRFYRLYKQAQNAFNLKIRDLLQIIILNSSCFFKVIFIFILLKRLKVKRFFAPTLTLLYPYIIACKKAKITSYELQHGITTDVSTTYSGMYMPACSPDYFLTFGQSSMQPLFGLPIERMINIGWAFKRFLKKEKISKFDANTYLFLSDPEITEKLVLTALELSMDYPNYTFHIRLHPSEQLTNEQKLQLQKGNIMIVNNTINSNINVMSYAGVIGVNTTVLYEAISVGIKAACISYNGLSPNYYPNPLPPDIFPYLHSKKDFINFAQYDNVDFVEYKKEFYSDFRVDVFNNLLKTH